MIKLNKAIFLAANTSYDIVLSLNPGEYYHGLPSSRIHDENISISKLKYIPTGYTTIGSDHIGGPISGFIIREIIQ